MATAELLQASRIDESQSDVRVRFCQIESVVSALLSLPPVRDVPLLTVGEAFDDLIFHGLERLPRAGEELRTNSYAAAVGGGALITAIAAARLGASVQVASGLGPRAAALLRQEGVKVRNLRGPDEPVAVSVSLSTRTDRAFVTFDGVNTRLEPRFAAEVASIRRGHVHLAFYPHSCARWATLVRRTRARGLTVSADFGWNEALARDQSLSPLIDALDLVFVNELEAGLYAKTGSLEASLPVWRRRRSTVIVKRGARGSCWIGNGAELTRLPPRVVRVVDTTGAGDAFNGGFLWAWLQGWPPARCLDAGNFVGARSTRRVGGIDGLPSLGDLPRALAKAAS